MATGETLIKDVLPILAKQQEAIEEIQAAIAAWGQPPAS